MRQTSLAFLLITIMLAETASALPSGVGPLIWSDEFNGTSLDTTKWGYRDLGVRNSATNTTQAVSEGGGALTITTYTSGGTNFTGMIGTQGLFQPTYGYFDVRANFSSAPGEWSAFWLQSPTNGNPIGNPAVAGVEADVAEYRAVDNSGNNVTSTYNTAIHWDGYTSAEQSNSALTPAEPGLANGTWHTYGLLWTPTSYTFYYDENPVRTVTNGLSQRSEYLILSSEVFNADWAGTIPSGGYGSLATSTTTAQFDYVRVYALPEPMGLGYVVVGAGALLRRRPRRGER